MQIAKNLTAGLVVFLSIIVVSLESKPAAERPLVLTFQPVALPPSANASSNTPFSGSQDSAYEANRPGDKVHDQLGQTITDSISSGSYNSEADLSSDGIVNAADILLWLGRTLHTPTVREEIPFEPNFEMGPDGRYRIGLYAEISRLELIGCTLGLDIRTSQLADAPTTGYSPPVPKLSKGEGARKAARIVDHIGDAGASITLIDPSFKDAKEERLISLAEFIVTAPEHHFAQYVITPSAENIVIDATGKTISAEIPDIDLFVRTAVDFDANGLIEHGDIVSYVRAYSTGIDQLDLNHDGRVDQTDFTIMIGLEGAPAIEFRIVADASENRPQRPIAHNKRGDKAKILKEDDLASGIGGGSRTNLLPKASIQKTHRPQLPIESPSYPNGASEVDATSSIRPVFKDSDRTPPRINRVEPDAGSWTVNQVGLTEMRVGFDQQVSIPTGAVRLWGTRSAQDVPFTRTYSSDTRTLTIIPDTALRDDRYTLLIDYSIMNTSQMALDGEILDPLAASLPSGDGTEGGQAVFQFNVLQGDVTRDGVVDSLDIDALVAAIGTLAGEPGFDALADLNADGVVNVLDVNILQTNLGEVLGTSDGISPTIDERSPNPGTSVRALTLEEVEIRFSEPVERRRISARSLHAVTPSGDLRVPDSVELGGDDRTATFTFDESLSELGLHDFRLSNALSDISGELLARENWTAALDNAPARLVFMSPFAGEDDVAVTRETIVEFDHPVESGSVTSSAIFAQFAGSPLPAMLHQSPSGSRVTLFYEENLQASARIRVTVDGDQLIDDLGFAVDSDSDGDPGGVRAFDFDTLSLTEIPGTAVCGRVFASELDDDGITSVDVPLAGVTITVDGREDELFAITDEMGNFRLEPAPVGRFFVHIDGRTSTNADIPDGAYYPFVGKVFKSVAGQETNPKGMPVATAGKGEIYLPLVAPDALRPVSQTQDTVVGFPQSVIDSFADQPDFQQALIDTSITVPADSLFADDGTRGGQVGIAPVPRDRLPGPLPPGLDIPLIITVQTDGPTNFDNPVPAVFPNLPDPNTGEMLPPGATTALWSFDHDLGEWVLNGTMTVSADGLFAVPDDGTGIRAPGWHGSAPGAPPPPMPPLPPPPCPPGGGGPDPDCGISIGFGVIDCGFGILGTLPGVGCAMGVSRGVLGTMRDCAIAAGSGQGGCGASAAANTLSAALGCVPGLGSIGSVMSAAVTCGQTVYNIESNCFGSGDGKCSPPSPPPPPPNDPPNPPPNDPPTLIAETGNNASNLVSSVFGSSFSTLARQAHRETPSLQDQAEDATRLASFYAVFADTISETSDLGVALSLSEQSLLLNTPLPTFLSDDDVTEVIARWDRTLDLWGQGLFTHAQAGRDDFVDIEAIGVSAAALEQNLADLDAYGFESADDISEYVNEYVTGFGSGGQVISSQTLSQEPFLLTNVTEGLDTRGRLTSAGDLPVTAVSPEALYRIAIFSAVDRTLLFATFRGDEPQAFTSSRFVRLHDELLEDSDADLLSDEAERIFGTDRFDVDSDDDGINDGTEVIQGTNPLDGLIVETGVIATAETPGTAADIVSFGNRSVIADGSTGISVFNVFLGLNPVLVAQVDTPGEATAVAFTGNLVAVADGSAGLTVIDVTDPPAATILHRVPAVDLGGSTKAVTTAGNIALVGTSSGTVATVDMLTGAVLDTIFVGQSIQDIAIDGRYAYVLTNGTLRSYDFTIGRPDLIDSVAVETGINNANGRMRLSVGGGRAYAVHTRGFSAVNVSDPFAMVREDIAGEITPQFGWKQIRPNGSGLGVAAMSPNQAFDGPHHVSLYDLDAITTQSQSISDSFLATFETPGVARAVSIFNGLAYVADNDRGLQVINYREFDREGIAPTVSFEVSEFGLRPADLNEDGVLNSEDIAILLDLITSMDLRGDLNGDGFANDADLMLLMNLIDLGLPDPATDGLVEDGQLLLVEVDTSDDVQVRNVELLIDGEVGQTDGNFPFQFFVTAPAFASPDGTDDPIPFDISVRASDTGGNRTTAMPVTLGVQPDRTAPRVVAVTPADGSSIYTSRPFDLTLSEPVEASTVLTDAIAVVSAGDDKMFGTSDDVPISFDLSSVASGRRLIVQTSGLEPIGQLRLTVEGDSLADAAGNALDGDGNGMPGGDLVVTVERERIPYGLAIQTTAPSGVFPTSLEFEGIPGKTTWLSWSSNRQIEMSVVSPGGNVVSSGLSTNGRIFEIDMTSAGAYRILLRSTAVDNAPVTFALSDQPVEMLPVLSLDSPVSDSIDPFGDVDERPMTLQQGDVVSFYCDF
ncbi:MAG: Ig-like domain-containing protein, partial [Phycisphaerales bacterium JB052]